MVVLRQLLERISSGTGIMPLRISDFGCNSSRTDEHTPGWRLSAGMHSGPMPKVRLKPSG